MAETPAARWMSRHIPPDSVRYRVDTFLGMYEMVKAGLGVGPLGCFAGDTMPALCRVTGPIREMETAIWILAHEHVRQSPPVRLFLDFVTAALERQLDLIEGRQPIKHSSS